MAVSREEWNRTWGFVNGSPEADAAWAEKCAFDARHNRASAMVISDHIDAVLSHADGKTYESKSALYHSYKPEGNPQGVRYECIGERVAEPFKRQTASKEQRREATKRALEQMGI